MDSLLLLLAVAIGGIVGIQPAVNARMGNVAGDVALAALISTLTSSTCLLLYVLILRPEIPSLATMRGGPWWIWTGGVLGAIYVAFSLSLAQRLGATVLVAVVLVGQMIAAIVVDHFGLLGLEQHPISPQRILGVIMLIIGVALIRLY